MLTLIQGPAGSGKSAVAAAMLDAGEIEVLADVTALWVALSGVVRGPDGRYPVRQDNDPALLAALYVQGVVVRHALQNGRTVGVTTSQRGQENRWQTIAEETGSSFSVRTVDPGRDEVERRLADVDGILSEECKRAIRRWFE